MVEPTNRSLNYIRLTLPISLAITMVVLMMALLPAQASPDIGAGGSTNPSFEPPVTNVITIGVGAVLAGPIESIGWRQLNSVQLAVDQVNDAGGIDLGGTFYDVALVYEDSECS
jgi:branched-chain amino acid transport system substrate-binding protein